MSDFHVHIEDRWEAYRLDFYVYERWGQGETRLHLPGNASIVVPANTIIPVDDRKPLLSLPREAAHPMLASLSRHLGAVEHPLQLRQDYEAERKRVDKFIEHVVSRNP